MRTYAEIQKARRINERNRDNDLDLYFRNGRALDAELTAWKIAHPSEWRVIQLERKIADEDKSAERKQNHDRLMKSTDGWGN